MGHENIGTIAKAGREFTRRKGFREGDLVFVEHYVSCGQSEWCHAGQYRHCENTNWRTNPDAIRYGYTTAEKAPAACSQSMRDWVAAAAGSAAQRL